MSPAINKPWQLESFLDSLIVELDKARETLAVKAINKPLTYAVKDVSLEMQLFPTFNGDQVSFVTAKPGQTGASKIAIQLGSITDVQIRKTTREPTGRDDVGIDDIPDIDEGTRRDLRKVGVSSVKDLVKMEKKNVDLRKVNRKGVDYGKLAGLLKKARRGENPPKVRAATLSFSGAEATIVVEGSNLRLDLEYQPVAIVNGVLARTSTTEPHQLTIHPAADWKPEAGADLVVALDPFTVCRVRIGASPAPKQKP